MSFIDRLDSNGLEKINQFIFEKLAPNICTLTNKYVEGNEEFSGTGLLVSDADKKYVLTANHVLDASARFPHQSRRVELTYHSIGLRIGGDAVRAYALRQKYWQSKDLDLALNESILSRRLDFNSSTHYYPIELLNKPVALNFHIDDLYVVCGFPIKLRTSTVSEVLHQMLIHYFTGRDGRNDPINKARFRIRFDAKKYPPDGMSGSPVWVIRNAEDIHSPLKVETLSCPTVRSADFMALVVGVVVERIKNTNEISAVKSDMCAAFVRQAQNEAPSLHTPDEEEWAEYHLKRPRS